jgi:hypothetical protein
MGQPAQLIGGEHNRRRLVGLGTTGSITRKHATLDTFAFVRRQFRNFSEQLLLLELEVPSGDVTPAAEISLRFAQLFEELQQPPPAFQRGFLCIHEMLRSCCERRVKREVED